MNMNDSTKDASQNAEARKLLPTAPKLLPVPYHDPAPLDELVGEGYRVMLFNDEFHSTEEVSGQLMKAIHCTLDIANAIMLRAHHEGQAIVTITSRREAEVIAGILREIALLVSVDPV